MLPALRANLKNLWVAGTMIALLATIWAPVQAQDATPMAMPGGAEPTIETLLDTTTDALPTGHAVVAVDRWTLQPGSTVLVLPPRGEAVMMAMESGAITATGTGTEHQLSAGNALTIGNQEVALHVTGPEAATAFIVYIISSGFGTIGPPESDPVAHAVEFLISTSADALPGGSARVILERLTLPPGRALPAQEASPLAWTEIGEGAVGLTLEGEQLPFRWKSGAERTFRGGQYLPVVQPGTRMTLRNAEDTPLVLYRLTITPSGTEGLAAATPGP